MSYSSDVDIAAAYDARAAEYIELAGEIAQMDARDRELIATWRDATSGPLLDAGCGPGLWTHFLHDGQRDVTGVDISEEFLAAARARYLHLEFRVGSLRALPFADASLGGILAWYSMIHTPPDDVAMILSEFARALAPGGSLLIGYFDGTPRSPFDHAIAPAYFWSADALESLLSEAGFVVVGQERRDRNPDEPSARPHGAVSARRGGSTAPVARRNHPAHPA